MNGWLLGAWIACQAFDTSTTAIGLSRGYAEANPLMRYGFSVRIGGNLLNAIVWHRETTRQRHVTSAATAISGCVAGTWNLHTLAR